MILFFPAYSPHLNPIEESFSTCEWLTVIGFAWSELLLVGKAYLRRHGRTIREAEDPIQALLESTACITPEMAVGWFRHAGYIW